jgi:hypothetical protein
VKKRLKEVIIGSKYFALSCDEVTTIDNLTIVIMSVTTTANKPRVFL